MSKESQIVGVIKVLPERKNYTWRLLCENEKVVELTRSWSENGRRVFDEYQPQSMHKTKYRGKYNERTWGSYAGLFELINNDEEMTAEEWAVIVELLGSDIVDGEVQVEHKVRKEAESELV